MPSGKWQLHQSGLAMLQRCGEQYRRRYVEGERIPPGVAAVTGTATHRSIAANLACKMETGSLAPRDEALCVAADSLTSVWAEGVRWQQEDLDAAGASSEKELQGRCKDRAVELSGCHYDQLAGRINPVAVERQWVVEIPGYAFDLAGTIDIQEANRIRDTKTSAKSLPASAAEKSDQLTLYALAAKVLDGAIPAELVLDGLISLKAGPQVQTLVTIRDDADMRIMLARIERATETIEKGAFTPANQDSWWCSERWCGYAPTCPFFRKTRVVVEEKRL